MEQRKQCSTITSQDMVSFPLNFIPPTIDNLDISGLLLENTSFDSFNNFPSAYANNADNMNYQPDNRFSCPMCSYTSNKKFNMSQHILTHTGEKPYGCPYCPYRSIWKRHIQIHMKVHDKESIFNSASQI